MLEPYVHIHARLQIPRLWPRSDLLVSLSLHLILVLHPDLDAIVLSREQDEFARLAPFRQEHFALITESHEAAVLKVTRLPFTRGNDTREEGLPIFSAFRHLLISLCYHVHSKGQLPLSLHTLRLPSSDVPQQIL